jgi:drug/metabolite transporter (DMT)-like permease
VNLTPRQLWVLLLLTLVWGLNWPVMKLGVSGTPAHPSAFPPLTFRALSMLLGLPVLAAALLWLGVPLRAPRVHWRGIARLAVLNMMVWHVIIIVAVQQLSSGRSAVLGYTMPVFSALWAVLVFGERLGWRQSLGVLAAALAVVLLLASEFTRLAGAPLAAAAVLVAACVWAYGTHALRRSTLPVALLTLVLWMTASTAVLISVLAWVFERGQWRWPEPPVWGAIGYNALGVFGFAHAAWFYLARTLPPVASGISVMLIPVLGTFSGAWLLGETLLWQDFAAVGLIVIAIACVLGRR